MNSNFEEAKKVIEIHDLVQKIYPKVITKFGTNVIDTVQQLKEAEYLLYIVTSFITELENG